MTYGLCDGKTDSLPMEPGLQLPKGDSSEIDVAIPYLNIAGSLFWIARMTRPDILYPVMYLSQFSNCYTLTHFKHLKRVLRYMAHTKDYVLELTPKQGGTAGEITISGIADAD